MKSIVENESFISLLAAAREDETLKYKLLSVLRQDDLSRVNSVLLWVESCKKSNAPAEFTEAISYLVDRDISFQVIRCISE